jgi:hypothetical protein
MSMKTYVIVSTVSALLLFGCEQKSKYEEVEIEVTPVTPASEEILEQTQPWCNDGLTISPLRVSGTSWVNGIGKTSPSILLAPESALEYGAYSSAQFSGEDEVRNIKSLRTLGNGRQVITFTGEVYLEKDEDKTFLCLK